MQIIPTPNTVAYLNSIKNFYQGDTTTRLDPSEIITICKVALQTLTNEINEFSKDQQFALSMIGKDNRLETIGDTSFTATELENVIFIQPLEVLTHSDFEDLASALQETLVDKNKHFVIIPYDIKVLRAKMIIKDTQQPTERND